MLQSSPPPWPKRSTGSCILGTAWCPARRRAWRQAACQPATPLGRGSAHQAAQRLSAAALTAATCLTAHIVDLTCGLDYGPALSIQPLLGAAALTTATCWTALVAVTLICSLDRSHIWCRGTQSHGHCMFRQGGQGVTWNTAGSWKPRSSASSRLSLAWSVAPSCRCSLAALCRRAADSHELQAAHFSDVSPGLRQASAGEGCRWLENHLTTLCN